MTANLFAYGTLMSIATTQMGARERARLHGRSRSLGPATMPGTLLDLGDYPGFVPGPSGCVHGEVIRLTDPGETFVWLDRYEGILPGKPSAVYRRELLEARLQDGTPVEAWVYIWQGAGGTSIPGGVWSSRR